MGAYLDRLNESFDTITAGIDEILNRAADENRDVSKEEAELVEREQAKAEDLRKSIDHYAGIEASRAKVADIRAKLPSVTVTRESTRPGAGEGNDTPDISDAFPTVGDYIVTVGRALRGDREAGELITRATQHQTTADNPGIIPNPILGPVITAVNNARPFIQSITNKALPTGQFSRPVIRQHVAVAVQEAEKTETASRKMLIDPLSVVAKTYAGHLNISRQDVKWSQPGIMSLVAEDFAHEYAVETDSDAVAQFEASVTADPVAVADGTPEAIRAALFAAAASIMGEGQGAPLPDTLWVAPDVWGSLGSMSTSNGLPAFPSVTPTDTTGNPLGLRLVVDPWFTPGTAIVGVSRYAEWFEDVDGLISVQEPDVLGQLVGYAGFGAFLNTRPDLFVPVTMPTPVEAAALSAPSSSKTASK